MKNNSLSVAGVQLARKNFPPDALLTWGVARAPADIGPITIVAIEDFLVCVNFSDNLSSTSKSVNKVIASHRQRQRDDQWAQQFVEQWFRPQGSRKAQQSTKLAVTGTDFQFKVWRALLDIPYGETRSYQQIADQVDSPNSVRAVGQAVGANPLMIVVPCHRVVRSDGALGGFAGGVTVKAVLLGQEALSIAA